MSQAPFEQAGSLRIGAVDFVSPDEIKVALDIEAPESVALNAGGPRPFPRVNGYLLIPVDEAFLVGQVEWLTVEQSPFPKRRGMQDFGLVDLPYPLRKLRLNPLGTLHNLSPDGQYAFRRGADALPSVGAAVVLPTESQLRSIVESGERRRVRIVTSPLAGDAKVCVDLAAAFGADRADPPVRNPASRPFPRVNGYLLIPVDEAFLVGQVEWLTVEQSPFPKRRGMQDFGLVDLPYPLRKLRLNPLGTLHNLSPDGQYAFRRGADALPSVGAAVVLPTESQLRSIVESGERRRVRIGTSPLAGDAKVCVDPNRLFGRHLAVLGNTGSGKSCSVAGLIRWSLEQAVAASAEGRPQRPLRCARPKRRVLARLLEGRSHGSSAGLQGESW